MDMVVSTKMCRMLISCHSTSPLSAPVLLSKDQHLKTAMEVEHDFGQESPIQNGENHGKPWARGRGTPTFWAVSYLWDGSAGRSQKTSTVVGLVWIHVDRCGSICRISLSFPDIYIFLFDKGESSNIKLGCDYAIWSSFWCQLVTLITPTYSYGSFGPKLDSKPFVPPLQLFAPWVRRSGGIDRICFIQSQLKTGLWMTADCHWTNGTKYGWHAARNWEPKRSK